MTTLDGAICGIWLWVSCSFVAAVIIVGAAIMSAQVGRGERP